MDKLNRPTSIKLMYWITNIVFWLYIITTIAASILTIAIFFGMMNNLQLHVGIPILAELKETGILDTNLAPVLVDVELTKLVGTVHLIDTPVELARIYSGFMMTILFVFLYIMLTFKRFITNVYNGLYFDPRNINQLKRISYTLVIVWILTVFYGYFQYFFIVRNLQFTDIEFTANVETYPITLLIALVIWVLSHIFQKGSQLQEEQKLTV